VEWKTVPANTSTAFHVAWLAVATAMELGGNTPPEIAQSLKNLRRGDWFDSLFGCGVDELFVIDGPGGSGPQIARLTRVDAANVKLFEGTEKACRQYKNGERSALLERLETRIRELPRRGRRPKECNSQPHAEVTPLARELRVQCLLGSELAYTKCIFDALRKRLEEAAAGGNVSPPTVNDFRLPSNPALGELIQAKTREFCDKHDQVAADYWVCIGSPAVKALREQLDGLKGRCPVPLLAAGVTNPAVLGLPAHQGHKHNIGVVRYGQGLQVYPDILLEHVFVGGDGPRPMLAFAYDQRVEHEHAAMRELQSLPLADGADGLKLVPFKRDLTLSDLWKKCCPRVTWGWYSLEVMMDRHTPRDELKDMMFVSTITTHAKDGLSAVAIQPSDEEIGQRAADMLLTDLHAGGKGATFGQHGVMSVREKFWVHRPLLEVWGRALGWTPPISYASDPLFAGEFGRHGTAGPSSVQDHGPDAGEV
jgi:hypothetical protein